MRHRQRGMTFLGLLIVLALCGVVGLAGVRLFPVYINYFKVVSTLKRVASEAKAGASDEGSLRNSIGRHWNIEDITGLDEKEVEIKRENGVTTLHAAYEDKVPYIANVSLAVDFDTSVTIE
jgi:Domain of unknown function (DUF4845)/Prokaryotic N-terminal methylation motif